MPELPEVETMRRGILGVVGATLISAKRTRCTRKPIEITPDMRQFSRRVKNKTVTSVDRIGKKVVIRLCSKDSIVLEPRMSGLVLVHDAPSKEHLRFVMEFENSPIEAVWYWDRRGLGKVFLYDEIEMRDKYGPDKLGPDALVATVDELKDRLKKSPREIKVALLDQKVIAGIGNLYAAEILLRAKVHPQKKCSTISKAKWESIIHYTREILEVAIKYEGSTLGDGTYRNSLNDEGAYQNKHLVYAREGEKCKLCKSGIIKRIVQAQRSTFFCPKCQKKS